MVDFHAHILPGADHGSRSLETSLTQIKLANECGVDKIIATPHFYPDKISLERFLDIREAAYQTLSPHIDASSIRLGAESDMPLHEYQENAQAIFCQDKNVGLQ